MGIRVECSGRTEQQELPGELEAPRRQVQLEEREVEQWDGMSEAPEDRTWMGPGRLKPRLVACGGCWAGGGMIHACSTEAGQNAGWRRVRKLSQCSSKRWWRAGLRKCQRGKEN